MLQAEKSAHQATTAQLRQAEIALREAVDKANSAADRVSAAASKKEAQLLNQVASIKRQLVEAQHAAPPAASNGQATKALERQLKRSREDNLRLEQELHEMSSECADLRRQLTEATQRALVCIFILFLGHDVHCCCMCPQVSGRIFLRRSALSLLCRQLQIK